MANTPDKLITADHVVAALTELDTRFPKDIVILRLLTVFRSLPSTTPLAVSGVTTPPPQTVLMASASPLIRIEPLPILQSNCT